MPRTAKCPTRPVQSQTYDQLCDLHKTYTETSYHLLPLPTCSLVIPPCLCPFPTYNWSLESSMCMQSYKKLWNATTISDTTTHMHTRTLITTTCTTTHTCTLAHLHTHTISDTTAQPFAFVNTTKCIELNKWIASFCRTPYKPAIFHSVFLDSCTTTMTTM